MNYARLKIGGSHDVGHPPDTELAEVTGGTKSVPTMQPPFFSLSPPNTTIIFFNGAFLVEIVTKSTSTTGRL